MRWFDKWWAKNDGRLDRNPMCVSIIVGSQYLAFSIMADDTPPRSVVQDAPRPMQILMCACILLGSLIATYGLATGSKYFMSKMKRSTSYKYAYSAAPSMAAGIGFYTYMIIIDSQDLWDFLERSVIPLVLIGYTVYSFYFWLEVRRIERAEQLLTKVVVEDISSEN